MSSRAMLAATLFLTVVFGTTMMSVNWQGWAPLGLLLVFALFIGISKTLVST